mmetsp:Transcript_50412/g.107060  ORF Transcript_50412/g.107060 Transcript_50412/m.107060 type:complete len:87 (+) Transcript_50412:33-293(+)
MRQQQQQRILVVGCCHRTGSTRPPAPVQYCALESEGLLLYCKEMGAEVRWGSLTRSQAPTFMWVLSELVDRSIVARNGSGEKCCLS